MEHKFYAVWGENGLGVFTDYDTVKQKQGYLRKFRCKKYNGYWEAKFYAIRFYNELQTDEKYVIKNEDDVRLSYNWLKFDYEIMEIYKNAG